jgi:hypothetical protein
VAGRTGLAYVSAEKSNAVFVVDPQKLQITKTWLSARGGNRRRRRRRGQRKREKILLKVRAVKLEAVDERGECGRRER